MRLRISCSRCRPQILSALRRFASMAARSSADRLAACGSAQCLLRCGQDGFRFGARLDGLTLREILVGVLDGLLKHPLDFRVADTVAGLHFDGALLTRTRVFRADLQYAVSVDQEFTSMRGRRLGLAALSA